MMGYFRKHRIIAMFLAILISVSLWRTCLKHVFYSQSQRNIWKAFLNIQEPKGCCIMRVSESSRWGGAQMICIYYEIESEIQVKKLIESIRNAAWNEKKNNSKNTDESITVYKFTKFNGDFFLYLEVNTSHKVKLTIGSRRIE